MKVGDLVGNTVTLETGIIVNIKKSDFGHRKLDLVRVWYFSLEGRRFETRSKNLVVISERKD